MSDKLTASEAIHGLLAWLTGRETVVTFSCRHDVAIAVDLIDRFCRANNLTEPRPDWIENLTYPNETDKNRATVIGKYKKKPAVVEAIRYTGNNGSMIHRWSNEKVIPSPVLEPTTDNPSGAYLQIETLEGIMTAIPGDFIIRGVQGEFYPCKPDIFEATYEGVGERTFPPIRSYHRERI